MLSGSIDPHYAIAGFLVGALVGVTGVGGGSLMTPILIVLFGVSPATAVGTDLLFAAATKTVGSLVHGFNRTIDWRVVRRLATGSIPTTGLALIVLSWLNMRGGGTHQIVTAVLSIALLLTAGALIARNKICSVYSDRLANLSDRLIARLTIAMGAVLGILVSFSSVGAGAIGVTALVLLYPRVWTAQIVGSDIAHAVPLTLIAGLGYGVMGSVDLHTLVSLLAGSLPGIFVGSSISARVPDIRYAMFWQQFYSWWGASFLSMFLCRAESECCGTHMTPASNSIAGSWSELRRMRTSYPETENTAACITLYLAFCMFVYGLFGFSFYEMLQPLHIANVGLAAYKPPVATVIGYDPTERVAYIGPMLVEEDASYETFDETAVASSSGSNHLGTEAGHN